MKREILLRLTPEEASNEKAYKPIIAKELNVALEKITAVQILKRSIDARKKQIVIQIQADVWISETPTKINLFQF